MSDPVETKRPSPSPNDGTKRGEGPDWWSEVARHWPRYVAGIIIGLAIAEIAIIGDWINFQWGDWFN